VFARLSLFSPAGILVRILALVADAPPLKAQINRLVFGGAGRSWSDVIQFGSLIDATSAGEPFQSLAQTLSAQPG